MHIPAGDGGGYGVRTEALIGIAHRSGDLGGKLVRLSQGAAEESATAVGAYQGWAISGALERLQGSCEHNIEGLGRWADDMADRISSAAREYERTDRWAMEKLHGVTRDTSQLKEDGWGDANDLLAQSLWENHMWKDEAPPPPVVPGSEQLENPESIAKNDGEVPAEYREWVDEYNPYGIDRQTVKNTYDTGAEIYADATGNRPVPVSETG